MKYSSVAWWQLMLAVQGIWACNSRSVNSPPQASNSSGQASTGQTIEQPAPNQNAEPQQNAPLAATGTPINPEANSAPYVGTLGGPNNAYTLVGRFDVSQPNLPKFSLPNSKVGGSFTGDTLGLMLTGDGTDFLSVFIDNDPEVVVATRPTTAMTLYPVAQGLGAGPHKAWFIKRTESYEKLQTDPNIHTSALTFGGFALAQNGAMGAPPTPRAHLIMAIGDSGFTGYGVGQLITATQKCDYSPATQNALLSVPAKVADLLAAELFNISGSGKGIANSAYDPNNPGKQLPAMWQMTVPFSKTPAYFFAPLPVDAVLVDGGSNDLVGDYGMGAFASTPDFIAKYTELLTDIRSHYPSAIIVGIINPNAIGGDKIALTQAIAASVAARTAAGDSKVFSYDYFTQDPNGWQAYNDAEAALNLGHGCQGHPSDAGAAFLAGRLTAFLRAKAGPAP